MILAGAPLGGHLVHAVPLLVPVAATAVVLGPDAVRRGSRALLRRPCAPVPAGCLVAAGGTATAALVHLLVLPEHLQESWLYGAFFLVLAAVQATYAWALLLGPPVPVLVGGVVGNAGAVLLWAVTRTVGLPVGPFAGQVEGVGAADLVAVTAEVVAVSALLLASLARQRSPRPAV